MDKRHAAAAGRSSRRDAHLDRDFLLAAANQWPAMPNDLHRHFLAPRALPGAAYPADADIDGKILAWIVSHVPDHARRKPTH